MIKFIKKPYLVKDNVQVFIQDIKYARNFGKQWTVWKKVQLDSYNKSNITFKRLSRLLNDNFRRLKNFDVLEVGSGSGRFTEILAEYSKHVYTLDISEAIFSNAINTASYKNITYCQADLFDLPFKEKQFDLVFCPGVIQHTPNPNESIYQLYRQVKPNGQLIFDQYRFNLSSIFRVTWIYRFFIKRLSPEKGVKTTNFLVRVFTPLHKKVAKFYWLEKILFRFSPISSFYSSYPFLPEDIQLEWSKLSTHDNLSDYYKKHTTLKKLLINLEKLNLKKINILILPYTFEVICIKSTELSFDHKKPIIEITKLKLNDSG